MEVLLVMATAVGFDLLGFDAAATVAASVEFFVFCSKLTMSFVGDGRGSVGVLAMAAAMVMAVMVMAEAVMGVVGDDKGSSWLSG